MQIFICKIFCRDNNLHYSHMLQVCKYKRNVAKGYHCRYRGISIEKWNDIRKSKKKLPEDRLSAKTFKLISPEGTEYTTKNLSKFCKDNNLCEDVMRRTSKTGKKMPRIGWTVYRI